MRFCKRCIEPDTRPGAQFDEEGICLPCRNRERYSVDIDWKDRRREVQEIADWAKERSIHGYDCIIPVSGGKDSTRQALYARDELGLTPLLVTCAYPPEQQTDRGAHNMANLIELGFDAHYVSPAPDLYRRLMLFGFLKFGNFYKSSELALFTSAPKVALLYNIPLIIYGENAALQWGGTVTSTGGDAIRIKYSNTLAGGDLTPYKEAGFDPADMYWYTYPEDDEMARAGFRVIYLGYYIPDFDDKTNAAVSIANGMHVRTGMDADPEMTGSLTEYDALDDDFVMINQMLKYFKFGFGKATQQLSGFIRTGEMTRKEAVEICHRIDGQCSDKYIRRLCHFFRISEEQFWDRANKLRDPAIWEESANGWRMKTPLS